MAAAIKSSVYHPSDIKQLRCQIVLPPERRITYLVRVSGCVVMTGAATTEEIITARNEIVQVVANFVTVPCPTVVDRLKPQRTKLTKSSDRDDNGKSYKRRRTPPLGLVGPKDWFRRPGEAMATKRVSTMTTAKKKKQ
jgi:Transcription factor TFIID (or TATA-binding protein, TBP)